MRFYNTLTRKLEEFTPLKSGEVGLYTCGPTVYWNATIGNFRTYVFEDVLQRVLEESGGYKVKRALNITDVGHLTSDEDEGEDKMEKGAAREGLSVWEIAQKYEAGFIADAGKLNIKLPEKPYLCRATDHIQEQIGLVKTLEEKGFTYRTSDGIYFDTAKFPAYGKLSGQKSEDKEEGARIEANPEKRNKTDFALWKFSYEGGVNREEALKNLSSDDRLLSSSGSTRGPAVATADSRFHGNDKGEIKKRQMEWESPWGVGFPGWHIECSAMARKYLGQPFDIHCGGIDHVPVHHENEIAQSEAAYGVELAKFWMHGAFLQVDGGKMSKSLGNVYTVDELKEKGYEPLALRYFYLTAHYRQPMNFTFEALGGAQNALRKLRNWARGLDQPRSVLTDIAAEFEACVADDLNTPKALAVVWKLVDGDYPSADKAATLLKMDKILGLSLENYIGKKVEVPENIKALVERRQTARASKNWAESDVLRGEIEGLGWTVEDTKEGQKVYPKE